MFGIADLVTVCIIEERFKFLKNNPRHLEFILGGLTHWNVLREKIGADHIDKAIEYITENKIHIAPFYEIDVDRTPAILVVTSGNEEQQFIGDDGVSGIDLSGQEVRPTVYTKWVASSYEDNCLFVSADYKLKEKIWRQVAITNGDFSTKLSGIVDREIDGVMNTVLYLANDIPEGIDNRQWQAQSDAVTFACSLGASLDSITIQCKLLTNGDFHLHRIIGTALRYCIKSSKSIFAENGIYDPYLSYSPPLPSQDYGENVFESVVTINAKMADHWIQEIYSPPTQFGLTVNADNKVDDPVVIIEDDGDESGG